MIERGVQPDLLADTSLLDVHRDLLAQFLKRGAEMLAKAEMSEDHTPKESHGQRRMDKIALDSIPPEDHSRRRWLEQAASNFYRGFRWNEWLVCELKSLGIFWMRSRKTALLRRFIRLRQFAGETPPKWSGRLRCSWSISPVA